MQRSNCLYDIRTMNLFWIQIIIGVVVTIHSCSCEKRLIEYGAPWQPVAIPAAAAPQLISIGNFDATNKAQIAQIAHHNAQILRQIKGLHPPVTQYLNPFPVYPASNAAKVVMAANAMPSQHSNQFVLPSAGSYQSSPKQSIDRYPTTQNLISSSSNIAQTVMPQTGLKSYIGGKPAFMANGKPEVSQLKFFNSIASSPKVPQYLNSASSSMPSFHMFSTTSRVPILRDGTLSSPSPLFKSTQLPHSVGNKFNPSMTFSSGSRPPSAPNQMSNQLISSSFTHFASAAPQIIRNEPKQRIRANYLTAPFEHYHFGNPYSGHLSSGGHFVAKNNFANSLYFPHNGLGSYQLTNTFLSGPQKLNSPTFMQNIQPQNHFQVSQSHNASQLGDSQPSHLPSLPTVPPSVLSPFFQVQQHQETPSSTALTLNLENLLNAPHSAPFHMLHDEYAINLVPPPPYKHTDSNRFRLKQSSTTSLPSLTVSPSSPVGPPIEHVYEDEQRKAMDILHKYNIPAISPLQDANRFSYNGGFSRVSSTTPPTPSFKDERYQKWQSIDNDAHKLSFTTEKPNIQYFNHPSSYASAKRPIAITTTPVLPTSDSLNNGVTHSFFTIEDAITMSPHSHYRRPVKPTNTNEIEASIKRPANDIYTETASIYPYADYDKEQELTGEIITTPLPPPSSTVRPRNKLRRKRPRPTTEQTSTIDSELNVFKNELDEFKDLYNNNDNFNRFNVNNNNNNDENFNSYNINNNQNNNNNNNNNDDVDIATEMPKNHKEYSMTRGQFIPFVRETTTTTEPIRESSTSPPRNNNRLRNRVRTTSTTLEPSSTITPVRTKRPYFNSENRRPNNRFEDNKVQRHRPPVDKVTRFSTDDTEQTTASLRESFGRPSRRPATTQQAIPLSTTVQDDVHVTEIEDFGYSRAPNRYRTSNPVSTIATSLQPTIDNVIVDTTQNRPDDIPSTRINLFSDSVAPTNDPILDGSDDDEIKTLDPQLLEISFSSTTTTSTFPSVSPEIKAELEKNANPSEGPVYIRDENKLETNNFRTRQRMRNKEKILEAVAAATSSQTKSYKDRGHSNFAHQNEVNDIETEPVSTEKDSRLRLRLPVYKSNIQASGETILNTTKTTRLNAINKYDPKNRPRFSIKEYRQRMSSTTVPTPESSLNNLISTTASYTRLRFPTRHRVLPADLRNRTLESASRLDEKPNLVYPEKPTAEPPTSPAIATSSSTTEATVSETTRKRFVPKDRYSSRLKTTTDTASAEVQTIASVSTITVPTTKPPLRRVHGRRDPIASRTRTTGASSTTTDNPTSDESSVVSRTPTIRNGTIPLRRPGAPNLRPRIPHKKHKEGTSTVSSSSTEKLDESLNDLAPEGSSEDKVRMSSNEIIPSSSISSSISSSTSTEEYKHETAIMKIAKDDHSYRPYKEKTTSEKPSEAVPEKSQTENDLNDSPSEHSERVAELTIFGTNQFNSVNTGAASRKIPGYFTLATEDPILPIEAFFPQVKRNN